MLFYHLSDLRLLTAVAYIGWLVLNNKPNYLSSDAPTGGRAMVFNAAMAACVVMVIASVTQAAVGLGWL